LAFSPLVRPWTARCLTALRSHGWIDGQNLIIEYRFAQSQDHLPALAGGAGSLSAPICSSPSAPQPAVAVKLANRYHSDCIRDCGLSRRDRPHPKPIASRRQHNGSCDFGTGGIRQQRYSNCYWKLFPTASKNCGLGPSGQSDTQVDNSRGAAPNGPAARRGAADSRGDHGRGTGTSPFASAATQHADAIIVFW